MLAEEAKHEADGKSKGCTAIVVLLVPNLK